MNTLSVKKQIATLGQIIVIVLLAATFFRLRVIESVRHREDFETITALGSLAELPTHNVLVQSVDDDEFRQEFDLSIQNQFISWLREEYPQLDRSRRQVRTIISEWLQKNGLSTNELADFSGKGFGDKYPFLFFRSSVSTLDSPLKNEAEVQHDPPIALLLEETRHLSSPAIFSIATALQDSTLPVLDFSVSQTPFSIGGYRVESLVLSKDSSLIVTFVENNVTQQRLPDRREFKIPVFTETVENVNLLPMLIGAVHEQRLLSFHTHENDFKRLLQTYGMLRLNQGEEITAQLMLETYQDVEMLGFKFSPQHFWVFVFIFQFVCLLATVIHIRFHSSKDNPEPSAFGLNLLLDNRFTRITLWCVIPSASMMLAYPLQSWILSTVVMYWGAIAILILTGMYVYRISLTTQTAKTT